MDEAGLTQDPYLCKQWCRKGQQKVVAAPAGVHWTLHVFGALNVMDDTLCWTLAETRSSDSMIAWLEQLMTKHYPTQNVCVVLDNASYHRSGLVQAAASLFAERLQLFFLPPHCPELNPIEPYWKHFKRHTCGNFLCTSRAHLQERAVSALNHQNDLTASGRYLICH